MDKFGCASTIKACFWTSAFANFSYFCAMNYTLTSKEVIVEADEFISRYRDVERIGALCKQCPSFGKMWCCPPYDFDPCIVSNGFKTVRLMATTIELETTGADNVAQLEKDAMQEVWQQILPQLYEMERETSGSRAFTFRCSLCPEGCTRPEGKPCRHPDLMRHSLESVGFDVVAMLHDLLDIDLEWSPDGLSPKRITIVTALFSE